jgi:isoleucyl-tRNA synthetase
MLWNVYKYFVEYANLDKFKPQITNHKKNSKQSNILDAWLLGRFSWLVDYVKNSLKQYRPNNAALEIEKFVSDLSTWYIRRSRDRLWLNSFDKNDKTSFYETLHYVLVNLSIITSPFLPFISEEIYTNLTESESVHLEFWPEINFKYDQKLDQDMNLIREVAEVGRRMRKELKIKVRQPLVRATLLLPKNRKFLYENHLPEYERLISEELNVKKIDYRKTSKPEIEVIFDSLLTRELIYEGRLRELVRQIQEERKNLGLKPEQNISLTIPIEFKASIDYLKKRVVSESISLGSELKVTV